MNAKGSGRGLILRYYPGIFMEGVSKTTKKTSVSITRLLAET
jgi:hypothetical protein